MEGWKVEWKVQLHSMHMRIIRMRRQKKITTLLIVTLGILSGGLLIAGGIVGNPFLIGAGVAGILFVSVGSMGCKKSPTTYYV